MIIYLPHKKIDKQKWDDCINQSPQGSIYALSWYLDIVSPNWAALVETENNLYKKAMPLPVKKIWGFRFLHQSRHTHELGIISRSGTTDLNCFSAFFKKTAQKIPYAASYSFNTSNTVFYSPDQVYLPAIKNGICLQSLTYHLHVNKPYKVIYKNYSTNQKRNLKKAIVAGLQLKETNSPQTLIAIFKANTQQKFKSSFQEKEFALIKQLTTAALARNACRIYHVEINGEICCAALFYFFKDKITYQVGTSTELGRKINAMSFLLDQVIQQHSGTSKILDFEGSPVPALARFYSSFGAQRAYFYTIAFNRFKPITRFIKPVVNLFRR